MPSSANLENCSSATRDVIGGWYGGGASAAAPDPASGSDAPVRDAAPADDAGAAKPPAAGSNAGAPEATAANTPAPVIPPASNAAAQAAKLAAERAAAASEAALGAKEIAAKGAATKEDLLKVGAALNRVSDLGVETAQQKETSTGAALVNATVSGLTDSDLQWSLLADAAITSLDFSQPTLSAPRPRRSRWWASGRTRRITR